MIVAQLGCKGNTFYQSIIQKLHRFTHGVKYCDYFMLSSFIFLPVYNILRLQAYIYLIFQYAEHQQGVCLKR